MTKKQKVLAKLNFKLNNWQFLSVIILSGISIILFCYILFLAYFQFKFFPGVKINSREVQYQTPGEIQESFNLEFQNRINTPVGLDHKNVKYPLTLSTSNPQLDLDSKLALAYSWGRSGNYLQDFNQQIQSLIWGVNFDLDISYQEKAKLTTQLEAIDQSIKVEPTNAEIIFDKTGVRITEDKSGINMDRARLTTDIENYLRLKSVSPGPIPLKTTPANFTTAKAEKAKMVLEQLGKQPLALKFEDQTWTITQPIFYSLLDSDENTGSLSAPSQSILDDVKVTDYLGKIGSKISQPVKEARFQVQTDPYGKLKVNEFQPSQDGRELDLDSAKSLLSQAINSGIMEINLPVRVQTSQIHTSDSNSLGIEELIATGTSRFAGSIANRMYNIGLASSRINGVLIPPGGTFSFTQTVGDITAETGYKQAYVIKSGRTVLDDGGGVCQVSTTVFRAALNAGVPITSRTAHAYRVGYYEQGFPPGLDATIFYPSVDLKFKNDTQGYILIQTEVNGVNLTVNFYGKKDGRIVDVTTPKILNQTPPPPELRQDDPTLNKGEVKQVEHPAWGANVTFKRTVVRDGVTLINETFNSAYRPW